MQGARHEFFFNFILFRTNNWILHHGPKWHSLLKQAIECEVGGSSLFMQSSIDIVKQSYFFILTLDESKLGGEADSIGCNFIFHEYTPIPMFIRSKRAK
jgi:hypothetical protein